MSWSLTWLTISHKNSDQIPETGESVDRDLKQNNQWSDLQWHSWQKRVREQTQPALTHITMTIYQSAMIFLLIKPWLKFSSRPPSLCSSYFEITIIACNQSAVSHIGVLIITNFADLLATNYIKLLVSSWPKQKTFVFNMYIYVPLYQCYCHISLDLLFLQRSFLCVVYDFIL